jgi:hypothetical protein
MSPLESEVEMVRRHVREGERHLSRQCEIVQKLRDGNHSTELAEELLIAFEQSLLAHRTHLARLVGKPA